jgi:hypothetical protein
MMLSQNPTELLMRDQSTGGVRILRIDADDWLRHAGVVDIVVRPQDQIALAEAMVGALNGVAEEARIVIEYPKPPPGVMAMLVPRTRIYIRMRAISKARFAVIAGLCAALSFQNAPIGVATAAVAAIFENVKSLADEEVEMLAKLQRLANGKAYSSWIPESELINSWPEDDALDPRTILASLASRGILEQGAGMWRAAL